MHSMRYIGMAIMLLGFIGRIGIGGIAGLPAHRMAPSVHIKPFYTNIRRPLS